MGSSCLVFACLLSFFFSGMLHMRLESVEFRRQLRALDSTLESYTQGPVTSCCQEFSLLPPLLLVLSACRAFVTYW